LRTEFFSAKHCMLLVKILQMSAAAENYTNKSLYRRKCTVRIRMWSGKSYLSSWTILAFCTRSRTKPGSKSGQCSLPQPRTRDKSFPVPIGRMATPGLGWNI
jgi:hypothetical protein